MRKHLNLAIAALPVAGVYVVVVLYHLTSSYSESSIKRDLNAKAIGVVPGGARLLFDAALIASTIAWIAALLFFWFEAHAALGRSQWRTRRWVVLTILFAWCIAQPLITSLSLPQALSLFLADKVLSDSSGADAASLIELFRITRLPGFTAGLAVAFTLGLLVMSIVSPLSKTVNLTHARRVRNKLRQGCALFILLAVLGVVRLANAQRTVQMQSKDDGTILATTQPTDPKSETFQRIQRNELVMHSVYYSMMAVVAAYAAMIAFKTQIEWCSLKGQLVVEEERGSRPATAADIETLNFGVGAVVAPLVPVAVAVIERFLVQAISKQP